MNAKQILATHQVWRLFNRKGRVTEARLKKALGRGGDSPTKAVHNVTRAYGVTIAKVKPGVFALAKNKPGRKPSASKAATQSAASAG